LFKPSVFAGKESRQVAIGNGGKPEGKAQEFTGSGSRPEMMRPLRLCTVGELRRRCYCSYTPALVDVSLSGKSEQFAAVIKKYNPFFLLCQEKEYAFCQIHLDKAHEMRYILTL